MPKLPLIIAGSRSDTAGPPLVAPDVGSPGRAVVPTVAVPTVVVGFGVVTAVRVGSDVTPVTPAVLVVGVVEASVGLAVLLIKPVVSLVVVSLVTGESVDASWTCGEIE